MTLTQSTHTMRRNSLLYFTVRVIFCAAAVLGGSPATAQVSSQGRAGTSSLNGRDKWADSAGTLIDVAVRRGDVDLLNDANLLLDRALTAFPNDALLLHYRGYALYRKATLQIVGGAERPLARQTLHDAIRALDQSSAQLPLPESYALKAMVLGQMIGGASDPAAAAMDLGPQAAVASEKALALGPDSPRVWLLQGITSFFTPAMWGGGMEKAEHEVSRSLALFANDSARAPMPHWGHAEAYIWLGQVYVKEGKRAEALAAFKSAEGLEPDNVTVKQFLTTLR